MFDSLFNWSGGNTHVKHLVTYCRLVQMPATLLDETQDILLTRNTLFAFARNHVRSWSHSYPIFSLNLSSHLCGHLVSLLYKCQMMQLKTKVFPWDFINWWNSFQQQNPTFWTFQTPPAGWSLRWSRVWPAWWSPRWWPGLGWPSWWRSRWWRPPSGRRVRPSPRSGLAKGRFQYLSFLCLSCGTLNKLGLIIHWIIGIYLLNIWE